MNVLNRALVLQLSILLLVLPTIARASQEVFTTPQGVVITCPAACSTNIWRTRVACTKYELFGCVINKCKTGADEKGYECATPTPIPTECPNTCRSSESEAKEDCEDLDFLHCSVQGCSDSWGAKGYRCAAPPPPPKACPSICKPGLFPVQGECEQYDFLRCSVQKCEVSDGKNGYQCAPPPPPPTSCPAKCLRSEKDVTDACKKHELLGCNVKPCNFKSGGSTVSGFTCATPSPTPTSCPQQCSFSLEGVQNACDKLKKLPLGCFVRSCTPPGNSAPKYICGTPTPTPTSCPNRCILDQSQAEKQCKTLRPIKLGCSVKNCVKWVKSESGTEKKDGYTCSSPTPTPSVCPDMCSLNVTEVRSQCYKLRGLPMGCTVSRCIVKDGGVEKHGSMCGAPTPTPSACPKTCSTVTGYVKAECKKVAAALGCRTEICKYKSNNVQLEGLACVDPLPTSCPNQCSTNRASVRSFCQKLSSIGCVVAPCGTKAETCMKPSPSPTPSSVPRACQNICRQSSSRAIDDCKKSAFLGCIVTPCVSAEDPYGIGEKCAEPTPAPTSCPKECYPSRTRPDEQCKMAKYQRLGCEVLRCDRGIGQPKYHCAKKVSSTPTACSGKCVASKLDAVRECRRNQAQGVFCSVQECKLPGGTGFSCGPPAP